MGLDSVEIDKDLAVKHSGIVASHADEIAKIAHEKNIFILARPVNKDSTQLIQDNYSTKGFHIKAKSSDWGPQAGFICTISELSKCYGDAHDTPRNQKYINDILKDAHPDGTPVPLLISRKRLEYLLRNNKILVQFHDKINGDILCKGKKSQKSGINKLVDEYLFKLQFVENVKSKMPPDITESDKVLMDIQFDKIVSLKQGGYLVSCVKLENNKAFNKAQLFSLPMSTVRVFATLPHNIAPNLEDYLKELKGKVGLSKPGDFLPITADYDIFAYFPYLGNFKAKAHWGKARQSLSPKSLSELQWHAAISSIQSALFIKDRRAHNVDNDNGIMTSLGKMLKDLINKSVKEICHYQGGNVVQHGDEINNIVYPNFDFPITVFTPAQRTLSCLNKEGLQQIFYEIKQLNYAIYLNRLWLAEEDPHLIREKAEALARKNIPVIEFDFAKNADILVLDLERDLVKPS